MKREWGTGYDSFAERIGNEDDFDQNCREDNPYPFGPTCVFKGKEIAFFCCNSESGSINGALLTLH